MKCENCDNEHDGQYGSGRFCSLKCARGFSTKANRREINLKVSKTLGGEGKYRTLICPNCNEEIKYLARVDKKFCSFECSTQYGWKKYKEEVEKTGNFCTLTTKTEGIIRRKAKRYLIEKYGWICMICGITTWSENPVPLVMDHIDGNSDNNLVTNCRNICRNCDGLLDTFVGKNIGNGTRSTRMVKYRKNKKEYL
jgi:hypothetical protein